jgi:hypothetical protein
MHSSCLAFLIVLCCFYVYVSDKFCKHQLVFFFFFENKQFEAQSKKFVKCWKNEKGAI